jgi:hypothetical protein
MGAASAREETPQVEENLKVSLRGHGTGSSPRPFGTGEPMHLAVELTIVNEGRSPVFIVSAKLVYVLEIHTLSFSDVCSENDPLLPSGRRKGLLPLLYHQPFPRGPRHPRTPEALRQENRFEYRLLRFICQEGSVFQIETGRGTTLTFPAKEVCGDAFFGWPSFAPQEILDELGTKTLKDFEEETRLAFEKAMSKDNASHQTSLSVDVHSFYYPRPDARRPPAGPPVRSGQGSYRRFSHGWGRYPN